MNPNKGDCSSCHRVPHAAEVAKRNVSADRGTISHNPAATGRSIQTDLCLSTRIHQTLFTETYSQSFQVHAIQHFGIFIAADVNNQMIAVLVRVDRVKEEEGLRQVNLVHFLARFTRYHSNLCL